MVFQENRQPTEFMSNSPCAAFATDHDRFDIPKSKGYAADSLGHMFDP